jgi:hypothetical protein
VPRPRSRSRPRPQPDRARTPSAQPRSTPSLDPTESATTPPGRPHPPRTAPTTAPRSSHRSPRHTLSERGRRTRHTSSFRAWPDLLNSSWGQPEPLSGQTNPREERPASQPGEQPLQPGTHAIVSSRR